MACYDIVRTTSAHTVFSRCGVMKQLKQALIRGLYPRPYVYNLFNNASDLWSVLPTVLGSLYGQFGGVNQEDALNETGKYFDSLLKLVFYKLLQPFVDLDYVYCFTNDDTVTRMTAAMDNLVQVEGYRNASVAVVDRCSQELVGLLSEPKRNATLARECDLLECISVFSDFLRKIRRTRLYTDSDAAKVLLSIINADIPRNLLGKFVFCLG